MNSLDKRLHVFRDDLADQHLQGKVAATRFVAGHPAQFIWPVTSVQRAPQSHAMQLSQALWGETCRIFDTDNGWAWVQLARDDYVGYVPAASLSTAVVDATHHVAAPSTHVYPKPDLKTQPAISIPMNANLAVTAPEGNYLGLAQGGFVFASHVSVNSEHQQDFVTVAEKFLHVPYLWGGKTMQGIDCSGLVQVSLHACGIAAPRDSDMQENSLGAAIDPDDFSKLQRGDLVFWKGHVGIMQDNKNLLHANGHEMMTVIELLEVAVKRIAGNGQLVTSIRRLQ
jgi:cell wall-associated NlpC family hydrolase